MGSDAKSHEACLAGARFNQDIYRLQVLVNEALPVGMAECCRQPDGNEQKASQIDRLPLVPLDYAIQRLTTRILKNENRSPPAASQRERLSCPCRIELGGK